MSAPTRLGVIGCGFFSRNHLNSWRDLRAEGAELAAVCDMDGAKAKAAAEEFGIPRWYDSAQAMFAAESLDLVEAILAKMCHAMSEGENVKISGFGSFVLRDKKERVGRNPKTGVEVPITPRRVMTFRASQKLKDRISQGA